MDGFESNEGVIWCATNRPDVLDPALLRPPGRFDRRVGGDVGRERREQILRVHSKKTPLGATWISTCWLVEHRASRRRSRHLVNEAALVAARQNRKVVTCRFRACQGQGDDGLERNR